MKLLNNCIIIFITFTVSIATSLFTFRLLFTCAFYFSSILPDMFAFPKNRLSVYLVLSDLYLNLAFIYKSPFAGQGGNLFCYPLSNFLETQLINFSLSCFQISV